MLFANAFLCVFTGVFDVVRIVLNSFSMMLPKTSLLFCCSCIRLFIANYVYVVPYGAMRTSILLLVFRIMSSKFGPLESSTAMVWREW